MYIIVGLGNPKREYDNTRHNIGFDVIDVLAEDNRIGMTEKKHKAIIGKGIVGGQKVILVKPQTYMNLSGEAVVEMINWYKITPNDIVIIYDDIDLRFGEIRYREKGSAGTHNGMRNIIANLKTEQFARIRIGIENRGNVPIPLIDYVLQKFSAEELNVIKEKIVIQVEENMLNFLTK